MIKRSLAISLILLLSQCGRERAPSSSHTTVPTIAQTPVTPTSDRPPPESRREVAILAGGCFWGMQEILRTIPGVLETQVGYTGGTTNNPNYEAVHLGTTGHAEAVQIVFDPSRLSYASLLEDWFFRMHDPTTMNRQGNDIGSQYRSAIFYTTPEQRQIAEQARNRINQSGRWTAPVVTEITAAGPFTRAEDYHQNYLQQNPGGYTCHYLREWH